jgi:hypothetical protein
MASTYTFNKESRFSRARSFSTAVTGDKKALKAGSQLELFPPLRIILEFVKTAKDEGGDDVQGSEAV